MPDPVTVLTPGMTVKTLGPSITVAALNKAGTYTFTLTVTDDAGLAGSGQIVVTVKPG